MFKNIVVPVDGSSYSDEAVDLAIEIASKFNSKILAVHVLSEFSSNSYDNEEDYGDEILGNVSKKANEKGIEVIEHLITGDPLRDMETIIRKTNADLVVIHSFGKDNDIFPNENQIGSITERVIRNSNIPILVVK